MQTKQVFIRHSSNLRLPLLVFLLTFLLLSIVQLKMKSNPMLLLERFIKGAGWIEIILISCYGAMVAYKMQNPLNVPEWRKKTWTLFSIVFFAQLIIGISGIEEFLMTGKLHLPIPAMILSGPLYRGHLSVMTILFLSTIILTGSAWCSHFCYFGAFDNVAASGKSDKDPLKNKTHIKTTLLFLIITVSLILRWFNFSLVTAIVLATSFGFIGVLIMIFYSRKKHKMIHCVLYCPIGSIVSLLKPIHPFRLYIDSTCNACMKCSSFCKYDALNKKDILHRKPDYTCTLCGDCLAACRDNSIKYKFFTLKAQNARFLYLLITISLHSACLALARI